MGFGKILCFLCEQTKKEKYKIALDTLVNEVRQLEEKYVGLPLYLEYETKFNEKENYNDIYRCMKCARAYFEDEAVSFKCLVNDLMTLIDMHENASEEVFDQYKQYAIWFKGTLKKILACQYKETEESARIAYCILKGCRLGALIQEKYQHIGEGIVQELLAKDNKEFKDLYQIGASAMAYAEFLKRSEVL
jgi:unsaturated rhamnogalacturonyl hydrolase